MEFHFKGYVYWFSMIDACYYKQKHGSFNKVEISKKEFDEAEKARWNKYL